MTQKLGREEAIRRLKAHSKPHEDISAAALTDSVAGETDRGAVILLATAVEDALATKIESKMVELNSDEYARMFGPDAPLGTFSALIRMGHALGIIDRDLAKACHVVREMRNACAHSRKHISFADPALSDAFYVLAEMIAGEDVPGNDPEQTKWYFGILIGFLRTAIHQGREVAAQKTTAIIRAGIAEAERLAAEAQASHDKQR